MVSTSLTITHIGQHATHYHSQWSARHSLSLTMVSTPLTITHNCQHVSATFSTVSTKISTISTSPRIISTPLSTVSSSLSTVSSSLSTVSSSLSTVSSSLSTVSTLLRLTASLSIVSRFIYSALPVFAIHEMACRATMKSSILEIAKLDGRCTVKYPILLTKIFLFYSKMMNALLIALLQILYCSN